MIAASNQINFFLASVEVINRKKGVKKEPGNRNIEVVKRERKYRNRGAEWPQVRVILDPRHALLYL